MKSINSNYFPYYKETVRYLHPRAHFGCGLTLKQKANNMKTNRSLVFVLAALKVAAFGILFAPVSPEMKVASFFGFYAILALVAVAVIEYRSGSIRELIR